jgi:exopolysaccharide biosynthesis protein
VVYGLVLAAFFAYVLLDTFVIPKAYGEMGAPSGRSEAAAPVVSDTSYSDGDITISIDTLRYCDTTVHIADVQVSDVRYLKTAFAEGAYGRNIKETTSEMAQDHNALLAVNGDYYGFRDAGCVLRNGELYREGGNNDALMLSYDGRLAVVNEENLPSDATGAAWQIWSFGPALVTDGAIRVSAGTEISGRSANSNPRTAIGEVEPLHYVFIVSEGRTAGNAGLSLLQLAELFEARGCVTAYNLDGGGSSTMYFGGRVVNETATSRHRTDEREVSDIVYIGYE